MTRKMIITIQSEISHSSDIVQNLPNVNGVGLPRVVRLNPKTRGKLRR
jgi:hypothetical protein